MAKKNNNYFELTKTQMSYCVAASKLILEVFHAFDAECVCDYRKRMHELEREADAVQHDIISRLSSEFITPIDQEDILHLVQIIDDITDALDEVILNIYMYHVKLISEKAEALSSVVDECVTALFEAVGELKSFKKPNILRERLAQVANIESKADGVYAETIFELFADTDDVKTLMGSKAIYDGLECCCDLCEHAADVIEQIIMKNT